MFSIGSGFYCASFSCCFLLTVFWKRTTKKAVNFTLSAGSVFSLGVGVMYLWVFTPDKYPIWPHYLLLSFFIFAFLAALAMIISLLDKAPTVYLATLEEQNNIEKPSEKVWISWLLLTIVMIGLYLFLTNENSILK